MFIFPTKEIPLDLYEYFEPIETSPQDVLNPSPENYSGQHFAVFPTSLIAPLIRATTPAQCCPICGAGWSPIVNKESGKKGDPTSHYINQVKRPDNRERRATYFNIVVFEKSIQLTERGGPTTSILGYSPTCDCPPHDPVPGTVFDPFLGSGTTARVARDLGLHWIGADLSFEYLDLQAKVRTGAGVPSNWAEGLPLFAQAAQSDDGT